MKKSAVNVALILVIAVLGAGAILGLEPAPGVSLAFQSPLSPASSNKIYLPSMARNYQPPPPAFLRAPYYGTRGMSSIFDHERPDYTRNNSVTLYNGSVFTTGWSYDGHPGYDYVLRYEPVLAAADGTVSRAQWNRPSDHRFGLGLYARLEHDNNYATLYGHLSAVTVDAGTVITNTAVGRIIGTSGNTGNVSGGAGCDPNTNPVCGAHLHFELRRNDIAVDPFGWTGNYTDPWVDHQRPENKLNATSHNVWLDYPAISNSGIYTSGAARVRPTPPPDAWATIVDDGDAGFTQSPANCWTLANAGAAYGGDIRYSVRVTNTASTCTAQWNLPAQAGTGGPYQVYAHLISYTLALPQGYVSTQGVTYTIRHAGQDDTVIVNQWAFTNTSHTLRWVYLGQYQFTRGGGEYVSVGNQTLDHDQTRYVLADAVKFIPLTPPPATATPTPAPPTPTRTPTSAPSTATRTPTAAPPTATRTPTAIPPTPTRTPASPPPTATATAMPCPPTSGPYEPNNNFAQAASITGSSAGTDYDAFIECPVDQDYYTFWTTVPTDKTRNIVIELKNIPPSTDYDLYLYDSSYQEIASSKKSGNADESIYYATCIPGTPTYYIQVKPFAGYNPSAPYRLRLQLWLSGDIVLDGWSSPTTAPHGPATFFSPLPTPLPSASHSTLISLGTNGHLVRLPVNGQGRPAGASALLADLASSIGPGCELADLHPSPTGVHIAVQVNCEWGGYMLLVDARSGQVTRLTGELGPDNIFLDWLPAGSYHFLALAHPTGDSKVYVVDVRTLQIERLSVPTTTYEAAFSPDGRRVVYATTEGVGHGSALWTMNRDGSEITLLRHEPQHIVAFLRWSPNGQRLAYIRMPDSHVPFAVGELWVVGRDGAQRLSEGADAGRGYAPAWSPNSRSIAFVGRENPHDTSADYLAEALAGNIYVADVNDGTIWPVSRWTQAWVERPRWSVNGRYLAFSANVDGAWRVWLTDIASRKVVQLNEDIMRHPAWMSD